MKTCGVTTFSPEKDVRRWPNSGQMIAQLNGQMISLQNVKQSPSGRGMIDQTPVTAIPFGPAAV
jgi:hypothetical protein